MYIGLRKAAELLVPKQFSQVLQTRNVHRAVVHLILVLEHFLQAITAIVAYQGTNSFTILYALDAEYRPGRGLTLKATGYE